MAIDLFGLTADEVRTRFPEVYQHVATTIKPHRDQNKREYRRRGWWLFGENVPQFRLALAGLRRYAVTVETAKHRTFVFVDGSVLPDNKLLAIATDDAAHLALLSSRAHEGWYLANAGKLGVYERDAVYVKSRCFDPFPFPALAPAQHAALAEAGERLDAFRKARLAEQPQLTLTRLYNALEARRAGRTMTTQEAADDVAGSVLILQELHEAIDRLTLAAYGLPAEAVEADILARLVALNAERAVEEARGVVRWLRPAYQAARFGRGKVAGPEAVADLIGDRPSAAPSRPTFPPDRYGQRIAVEAILAVSPGPLTPAEIAARYRGGRRVAEQVDATLRAMAQTASARRAGDAYALNARRAA